jgi:TetR/AcrR family transcriptional repressor of nem operon
MLLGMRTSPSSPAAAGRVPRGAARERLLDAALGVIRERGLHATSVDDLCTAAGVTKGAFFHHFASKEDLAVAAADHWSAVTGSLFTAADYHRADDPLERVLGYLDLRDAIAQGAVPEFTCLVGTMVQEAYLTSPAVRDACAESIYGHAATLEADFAALLERPGAPAGLTARGLAEHTQAVLQGAFVLAKARDDTAPVHEALGHLRRYLTCLFGTPEPRRGPAPAVPPDQQEEP